MVEQFNSSVVGFAKAVIGMRYEIRALFLFEMIQVHNNRHTRRMNKKNVMTRHEVLGFPFF